MRIISNLNEISKLSQINDDINCKYRQFIKYRLNLSDNALDNIVHEIYQRVLNAVDCTACGNCCRIYEIQLLESDINRMAEYFNISVKDFMEKYTASGEETDTVFNSQPCPFLSDNKCGIYEVRPQVCREYPHADKDHIRSRMWGMLDYSRDCPLIFNLLETMKAEIPYYLLPEDW